MRDEFTKFWLEENRGLEKLVLAGNGRIVSHHGKLEAYFHLFNLKDCTLLIPFPDASVHEYATFASSPKEPTHRWPIDDVQFLVAGQTHFAFLNDGKVYTWGDERYDACLGRGAGSDKLTPADEPGLVTHLVDLPTGPICKIVAGGYASAALTRGQDLYVWGGRGNQDSLLSDISGDPIPLDLHGYDVSDAAIGDHHMMVLTTEQTIWTIGEGVNGQLGLGQECQSSREWRQVAVNLRGREIVSVAAGPKSSFLLVRVIA
ncbi:MAG: hypothetical protein M1818_006338 [Claussenomyces sp. TS43310]|nr:MAG: hypothetical protein M1818_006338 [Claussenomyces sp. TS43310]